MRKLWQDTRRDLAYGLRKLRRKPAFTALAVLVLALGIGANTAIFSVLDAVLLRPLPYEESQRLVLLWGYHPQIGIETASLPDFTDWRQRSESFEDLVAYSRSSVTWTGGEVPERLTAAQVSAGFFPLLRIDQGLLGRGFLAEEDRPGGDRVAVLGHALWQKGFGGDRAVLGRSILLDGEAHTVVGVAPASFQLPAGADLWLPLAGDPQQISRRADFLVVLGRLLPQVTEQQAQQEMTAIAAALEQEYPDTNTAWTVRLVSLQEQLVGDVRPALWALAAAVAFVLLIACANVANLQLTRALARDELVVRAALGASRGQLVRQLLVENLLLAVFGGAAGLLLALGGLRLLTTLAPVDLPRLEEVGLDGRALVFCAGLSLLTGLLFGLLPAVKAAGKDLMTRLRHGSGGGRGQGIRGLLVATEVAVALLLLIGAGLMLRSLESLLRVDPGFDPRGVLSLRVSLPPSDYPEAHQVQDFFHRLRQQTAGLPGVEAVGAIDGLYIGGGAAVLAFGIEGQPPAAAGQVVDAHVKTVSGDFYQALGMPILEGRALPARLDPEGAFEAVVNQELVRRYFPSGSPLGQRVAFSADDAGNPQWRRIVGVVGDVHQEGLDLPPYPEIHVPLDQSRRSAMTLVVRTDQDPTSLAGAISAAVRQLDPDLPVYSVQTLEEVVQSSLGQRRFVLSLFGIFAAIALILATVGIYGVLAFAVGQRTREIGVRMAMGARPRNILGLVMAWGLSLTAVGIAVGLIAAWLLTRYLDSLLFGVEAADPLTFLGITAVLAAAALLACLLPARRAIRIDPVTAVRSE